VGRRVVTVRSPDGRVDLIVGIFVTGGFAALVTMILVFSGGGSNEPMARYTVLFERDISGLTIGAPARYMGVDVGQVSSINLVSDKGTRVRVDIEVKRSTPVTTATFASLAFQGVTGVAFVSVAADQTLPATPIMVGDSEYPVIPARDVGLAALLSSGPEITDKISKLLDSANYLLGSENQQSLKQSLANIERLTASLAAQDEAIDKLPQQLLLLLGQIEKMVVDMQAVLGKAEPDLMATMQQLNRTSEKLASISGRVDDWLARNEDDMEQFVDGGLGMTPALIADTRSTVRDLEKLVNSLRENPSQLVYKQQNIGVAVEH
jgi:phospholipid/cholesterol/gamma-HCH transport system substrate-binding protein